MEKIQETTNVLIKNSENVKREKIRTIPITLIDNAPNHPFYVTDNEEMTTLMESISLNGVLAPCIVRKKDNERFELVSGHRRKYACCKLGIDSLPAIVRDMTDDEAIIAMVDSNLQREVIFPSEKAFAYKMKYEALKRQGKRTDLTSTPVVSKLRTAQLVGMENGDSREQVRRYIRLTYLIPELIENVDMQRIALRPAVEISYLDHEEQKDLSYIIDTYEATPSLSQAILLKKLSKEKSLDIDTIAKILTQQKTNQVEKIKITASKFDKYFARGTLQSEMETVIFAALDEYYKRRRTKSK